MKEELKKVISKALNKETKAEEIAIEIPKDKKNGDFSTNVAMKLSKQFQKSPVEIANMIKDNINNENIDKIEIAGPGFINFYVNKNYLFENIKKILVEKENYGKVNVGNNEKVNLEYVSVNPTGIIHLGHARGACFGDSLARILSFAGYDVTRE